MGLEGRKIYHNNREGEREGRGGGGTGEGEREGGGEGGTGEGEREGEKASSSKGYRPLNSGEREGVGGRNSCFCEGSFVRQAKQDGILEQDS